MRFLILVALLGVSFGQEDFLSFSQKFSKSYKNIEEFQYRRSVFNQNVEKMVEHNKRYATGEVTWFMKIHDDMDLTEKEWKIKRKVGLPTYSNDSTFENTMDSRTAAKLKTLSKAATFDWVSQGKVTPIKNQDQCGSCAVFSVVAAVESCQLINYGGAATDLAEQHVLDCAYGSSIDDASGHWTADGCLGGWLNVYTNWLIGKPIQNEMSYPYTSGKSGQHGACTPANGGDNPDVHVTGMWNVWNTAERDMESLVQINPVSTDVLATDNWFSYGGGVLDDSLCCDQATDADCSWKVNHAVLIVGYGTDSATGLDYWLIKNSWDTWWGDNGYMKLKRGTGHCGVGSKQQTIPYC